MIISKDKVLGLCACISIDLFSGKINRSYQYLFDILMESFNSNIGDSTTLIVIGFKRKEYMMLKEYLLYKIQQFENDSSKVTFKDDVNSILKKINSINIKE